jgi:hypothetical protein
MWTCEETEGLEDGWTWGMLDSLLSASNDRRADGFVVG